MKKDIKKMVGTINRSLAGFLDRHEGEINVSEPFVKSSYAAIREYALSGGKRLRPLAVLLAYKAAGGKDSEEALLPAVGIELHHTYSLILDDLMDEDEFRRGHPAIQNTMRRRFSDVTRAQGTSRIFASNRERMAASFAIMLGNITMLLSRQAILESSLNLEVKEASLQLMNRADEQLYHGQMMDVLGESQDDRDISWYTEMIRLKTGSLFGLSFQLGSLIAGADQDVQGRYWQLGIELAKGFQLLDDLKDITGKKGRPKGTDIREGKKTYLFLKTLESADDRERNKLKEIYAHPNISQKQMKEVISIMERTGAIEACREMAMRSLHEAQSLIEDESFSHDPSLRSYLSMTLDEARP